MLTFDYNWIETRQGNIFENNTICFLEMTGDCGLIFWGNFRQKCVKIKEVCNVWNEVNRSEIKWTEVKWSEQKCVMMTMIFETHILDVMTITLNFVKGFLHIYPLLLSDIILYTLKTSWGFQGESKFKMTASISMGERFFGEVFANLTEISLENLFSTVMSGSYFELRVKKRKHW